MYIKRALGYSLLELLVVISIMGIVFAGGFASYREYQRRQDVQSVARMIRGDLRLAQEYALAGKKPTDPGNPCLTNTLEGYYFWRDSSQKYSIRALCGTIDYTIKTVDFQEQFINVYISAFAPSNKLLFKILGRGTNCLTPMCINSVIDAKYNAATCPGSLCERMTVTQSGEIR